jgi:hypothetical protein
MSATRQQIVDDARRYLGVKYKHMGFEPAPFMPKYLDCAHLLLRVGIDLGLLPEDLRLPGYAPLALPRHFDLLEKYFDPIAVEEIKDGDVIVMCHKPEKSKQPAHLAIAASQTHGVVTEHTMIQVYPGASILQVTEHSIDELWQSRIVAGFRFRGVED